MLLNAYAQPTILKKENINIQLNIMEFKASPMLLCHTDSLVGRWVPRGWIGTLYSSENIITEVTNGRYKFPCSEEGSCRKVPLMNNEAFNVTLHNGNNIKLIMVCLNDNQIFIIKDEYVTSILTDNITLNDLHAFQYKQSQSLRECIKEGIDVLYINDAAYDSGSEHQHPSKFVLKSLTTLVKPVFLKGLSGKALPQSLLDCCKNKEDCI